MNTRYARPVRGLSDVHVWLTFDDGPTAGVTEAILVTLGRACIRAAFFVCGAHVEQNRDLLRAAANDGHEIGNHSWRHVALDRLDAAAVRQELVRTNEVIGEVTGLRCRLFRPPYGAMNDRTQRVVDRLGLVTVLWSVAPEDWECPGAAQITRRVLRSVQQGDIVLLHDGCGDSLDRSKRRPRGTGDVNPDRSQTATALPKIISGVRRRGLMLANRDVRLAR